MRNGLNDYAKRVSVDDGWNSNVNTMSAEQEQEISMSYHLLP
jgi:hypothetical protein